MRNSSILSRLRGLLRRDNVTQSPWTPIAIPEDEGVDPGLLLYIVATLRRKYDLSGDDLKAIVQKWLTQKGTESCVNSEDTDAQWASVWANAVDWAKLDWSRPSEVIAEETGRTLDRVSELRRIHAPETVKLFRKAGRPRAPVPLSKSRYARVNWKLSDRDISDKIGGTPAAVRMARKRYGMPKHKKC